MEQALPQLSNGFAPTSRWQAERVGRDGALRLAFEQRSGRTVLTERRFTLPFQVLEPISLDHDGSAYLMLLNPTGGLVGGDHLVADMTIGAGSHVCLTTPSATKVYRTLGPPAVQETRIRLGEGAVIEYLPDHVIPFPGSSFHQSLTIDMSARSCAIVFDALAMGRLVRGERWDFQELVNRVAITCQGRPIFLDRVALGPSKKQLAGLGGMEGFGYVATFGLFAESFGRWEALADALRKEMNELPSLVSGVSLLARCGCIVRILAGSAPDLSHAFHRVWARARQELLALPSVGLRK